MDAIALSRNLSPPLTIVQMILGKHKTLDMDRIWTVALFNRKKIIGPYIKPSNQNLISTAASSEKSVGGLQFTL
jgi:hypothetical protein